MCSSDLGQRLGSDEDELPLAAGDVPERRLPLGGGHRRVHLHGAAEIAADGPHLVVLEGDERRHDNRGSGNQRLRTVEGALTVISG